MLELLKIENFALFEKIECSFSQGLSVLSGETGAGKSILMEALGAVLGGKVSGDYIRTDAKSFYVEAVFSGIAGNVRDWLAENGFENLERLVIARRYYVGRSEQYINGARINLQQLKQLAQLLVDIHGQHDHQALLREQTHLELLDLFKPAIAPVLREWQTTYARYRKLQKKLEDLRARAQTAAQRSDILNWQIREINEAGLKPDEELELEDTGRRLANAEKISGAAGRCYDFLNGGRIAGALEQIHAARQEAETVARFYPVVAEQLEALAQVVIILQDLSETVSEIGNGVEFDQNKLDKCYSRLEIIKKLKRKYGATVEEVLAFRDSAAVELRETENVDMLMADCDREIMMTGKVLLKIAEQLSKLRAEAAELFSGSMAEELAELALQGSRLKVELARNQEFSDSGMDSAEIMFSANIGEPVKPLAKVVSGGELSRIALAVKTRVNFMQEAQTVVFDEIDSGVGGKTAIVVAEKLRAIAGRRQVICISHSPQIAAAAETQYLLEKSVNSGRTVSKIKKLGPEERITELARMLSGVVNEKTKVMAGEMLKGAGVQ